MVSKEFCVSVRKQFEEYSGSFKSNDLFVQQHFNVKQQHSFRVCEIIKAIGKKIGLDEEKLNIAEVIGLLHDIGRFEQYNKFGTFSDFNSVNHAELGIQVINDLKLLSNLNDQTQSIICKSILNHNIPCIPSSGPDEITIFSKLLRDADKLDIYKVVQDYEEAEIQFEPAASDDYKIPDKIFNSFTRRYTMDVRDAKCRNDFFLLRLSWIFDINFQPTFQMLDQKNYVNYMIGKLPKSYRLNNIQNIIKEYMVNRIFSYA